MVGERDFNVTNEVRAIDKLCKKGGQKNIVTILGHGELTNSAYYFFDMEFCDLSLDDFIQGTFRTADLEHYFRRCRENGELTVPYIWTIMLDVARGIDFIHSHNEVHRDLKPSNGTHSFLAHLTVCIVLFSLNDIAWKITDFGLTSEGTSNIQTSRYARGASGYRAPELLKEKSTYTNKVDIFALGCTFYELATGKKAFPNDIAVHEYGHNKDLPENPAIALLNTMDQRSIAYLSTVILKMVNVNSWSRPSARILLGGLTSIMNAVQLSVTELKLSPYVAYVSDASSDGTSFRLSPVRDAEIITDDENKELTDTKFKEEPENSAEGFKLERNDEQWQNVEWQPHWLQIHQFVFC